MSKYTYKYTPNGKNAEIITTWLKNQPNKAESLNMLILQAERKYGNRDIVDMTTQAFLNDEIGNSTKSKVPSSTEPVVEPTDGPTKHETQLSNPEPEPIVDVDETSQESNIPKPDLKFLSRR